MYELREVWSSESELMEKVDVEEVEGRGADPRKKIFKVSTDTSK